MRNELANLALTALLALASAGCESSSKAAEKGGRGAVPVQVAEAKLADVPIEVSAFGSVEASQTVEVVSQVTGLVTQVHFKEGDFVKKGDLLFTVDTRPYRASLAVAQAELARNQALAEQAKTEAERTQRLEREGLATQQQLAQAEADRASSAATVEVGRAQIQSANLNVAFTRITSPIDGRTGSVLVHAGNVVHANATEQLVVIRSLSPVRVRFAVPQDILPALRERLGKEPLRVRATLRGEGAKPVEGPLTFFENTVDPSTGTLTLKATFANTGLELWPGAAVDVVLELGVDKQAVVVPEAAVQRGQAGTYVFVIDKDSKAVLRQVDVKRFTRTEALIRSGLVSGERVAVDGQVRLKDGAKVSIKPAGRAGAGEDAGDGADKGRKAAKP
jgi:multidrug efflux system membrane fusion protein